MKTIGTRYGSEGRRRRLLEYVKRKDIERYRELIKDLGLRH